MTVDNSEAQDIVDIAATENTGADSQEIKEWDAGESEAQEQPTEQEQQAQEQEEAQKAEKKNRAKERIEQLARENAELRRFKAEQEARSNDPQPSGRPKIDDFESFGEYEAALDQYHIEQAEARVLAKLDQRESQKSEQQKQVEFQTAIAELEDQGIDFNTYAQKAESLPVLPIQLDQFGLSATETLKLAKDLLDDEDTYIAISQMNPVQAAMKIGQIIESKKSKPAPPVSKAPKPINPVKANAPATRSPENMSDDEWYKAETQRRKGK